MPYFLIPPKELSILLRSSMKVCPNGNQNVFQGPLLAKDEMVFLMSHKSSNFRFFSLVNRGLELINS